MNLILIAALIAASSAAKLDRSYLPPPSAKTAGGSPDSLQTPFARSSENQGLGGLPSGSYENEFQGVVVDAANPGTRTSAGSESGLGAPRISYGSSDSKVGEAAFRGSLTGFRQTGQGFNQNFQSGSQGSTFGATENKSERPQAAYDRAANIVKHDSDVGSETYSYGFETDNGIAAGENGVAINGVQAQGGFSYKGDDGQTYSITYTADEGGYRPQGNHLPTPPPIPDEILKSLEQNAKDEAAGLVDDGSYDAQKYNEGDYSEGDNTNTGHSQQPGLAAFNQNQGFGRPSTNSGYSGTNGYRPNGNSFGQAGSKPYRYHSDSGNANAGNSRPQFGKRPGSSSLNQNQAFGNPSTNFANPGTGYKPNRNNIGQAGTSLPGTGYQSSFNTVNQGGSGQGVIPKGEKDASSGQFNPNQASAQAQSYGHGQTSAQASTGPHFGHNNKFENHGIFGSQNQQGAIPQFNAQSSRPQFGQSQQSVNTQVPQTITSSQVDNQAFQPDAEELSSNVDSLNQGQSAQASASIQPFSQQGFGSHNSFNRPSSSGQTTFDSANGFASAPNNANSFIGHAAQTSNNKYGNSVIGNRPIQGSSQKPIISPAPTTSQFSTPQASSNLQGQSGQELGFQSNQASSEIVRPSLGAQTSQFNGFQQTQTLSNGGSTPFSLNANNVATQGQYKPQYPNLASQSNILARPTQGTFGITAQATKKPDIELTTPLEPNQFSPSKLDQIQPTDSSASSFASIESNPSTYPKKPQFGSQTLGVKPSSLQPGQAEFGVSQSGNQSPSVSQASAFATSSPVQQQTQPETAFPTHSLISSQSTDKQAQFGLNTFSQNRPGDAQFASSTQKPTFGQPALTQGIDDSYYYNQPSEPFNTPNRPFGSELQSTPSSQLNGVNQLSGNRPQNYPTNVFPAKAQPTQSLGSSSLVSSAPTSPAQNEQTQEGGTSSSFNGVTQASISPFGGAPTPATQFNSQFNQFESKPSVFNKPAQSTHTNQLGSQQSQYGSQQTQFGPTPLSQQPLSEHNNKFPSSQFGFQQNQFGSKPTQQPSSNPTQFGSPQNQFGYKPSQQFTSQFNQQTGQLKPTSQFGSQQTQFGSQQTQFGVKPLAEHNQPTPLTTSTQFGSQQTQFGSQQAQFGAKPLSQQTSAEHSQPAQSTTSTLFGSQQVQFGVKPLSQQPLAEPNQSAQPTTSTQLGSQQTQFGSQQSQFGVKPLPQESLAQYNQPAQSSGSTQFGSQQTQFGSQQTQFGDKLQSQQPTQATTSSQFGFQQTQFGLKPLPQQPLTEQKQPTTTTQISSQQTQFNSQQFGVKPLTQQPLSQPTQQNQFGLNPQPNPFNQQTGSSTGQFSSQQTQFGEKPFPQQSINQLNQPSVSSQIDSQSSQLDNKPLQSQSQFGLTHSNTPQKPTGQFGHIFQNQFSQASVESRPSPEDTSVLSKPTQQYTGELYEYNKPDPVPSASSEASASGQNAASAQASVTSGQTDSSAAQTQDVSKPILGAQAAVNSQSSQNIQNSQFGAQPFRPFGNGQTSQVAQSTADTKPQFPAFGKPCCQGHNAKPTQSSFGGPTSGPFKPTNSGFQGTYNPNQASAGLIKGEEFGGPRNPPKFDDKTGYHY